MASITSPGIGSGLDINSLVGKLVDAQKTPQLKRLDSQEAGLQAQLSAFGTLKGALSSLQSSLASLNAIETYRGRTAESSDTSVLTATANVAAAAGIHNISLSQLATVHKLATDPVNNTNARFTATTDLVGTGTLTFKFGTTVYDKATDTYTSFTQNADRPTQTVTITDGSLQGIRDAVNKAGIGVTASIVFDGSYQRLSFAADQTGAANSLEVTVQDSDANNSDSSGLSLLAFNSTATNLNQTQASQDTVGLNIDGIAVSSASNTLTDTIEGLSIELKAAGTTTLNVALDKNNVSSAINSLVEKYNALVTTINDLSSFDPETKRSGLLNGNGVLRSIDSQLRRLLSDPVQNPGGPFKLLTDIGISRNSKDGTLVLDNTKLDAAISSHFDDIASLFTAVGTPSDPQISFVSSTPQTPTRVFDINITRTATQGELLGAAAANLNIVAGVNDELTLSVDGVAATVQLSAGNYNSATALAAEVQSRINGAQAFLDAGISVKVSESAGVLKIVSDRYGAASKITISGGNGRNDLVGTAAVATDGQDVAGTIGGAEASGSGQQLTGSGSSEGISLKIAGGVTGNRGTLTFSRGYAETLNNMLTGLLDSKGIFSSVTEGINNRVEAINNRRLQVERRSQAYEKRIRTQFVAMDLLVSRLRSTGSFLAQQLGSLPGSGGQGSK